MALHHLHIFLSSPGDVSRERQLAREFINQLQSERAYQDRFKLEVVDWEKPGAGTAMPAHLEPQEAINKGLKKPSHCNIVIVVFWARMGTPLSEKRLREDGRRYRSGTEYEFLEALATARKTGKPDILVYRRQGAPAVPLDDPEHDEKKKQWSLVQDFFSEFKNPDGSYRISCRHYNEPSDFRKFLAQDLRDLITQYPEPHPTIKEPPSAVPEVTIAEKKAWEGAPYPGLRAFTHKESLIFHGRGHETDALISRLNDETCRFIAVVGASGSGKSSLVAAGLLPALAQNGIAGSQDWLPVRFTPAEVGENPFMAFANAIKPILEEQNILPRDEAKELEAKSGRLRDVVEMAMAGRPAWAKLLLFIDQFEEFFTLVDPKYQNAFVGFLVSAARMEQVRILVTMRADFYHRCLDWPELNELVARGQYPLLAPKVGALHEMIRRPAEQAGLRFDEGLVQRILDDTGAEPGALALMAFALSELWKIKSDDDRLAQAAYDGFNGVHGAIGKRAEATFMAVEGGKHAKETALAAIFRELVEVDERGVATRRRTQLAVVTATAETETMINALTDTRLLVTGRGEGNESVVEVAHEAIFTNWERLEKWIDSRNDDLRLRRQLAQATAEWQSGGKEKRYHWPDERIMEAAVALERLGLHVTDLSSVEQHFLGPIDQDTMLAKLDDPTTFHTLRATIGDRLSLIGDPRPGVGLRRDKLPDLVWCKVEGGKISLDVEKPHRLLGIFGGSNSQTFTVEPFYIAKFPITWIQYRAFLDDKDGFANPAWWEELLFQVNEPGRELNQGENHPVVDVCWLEVVAFCRWLTEKLGYEVRLPTEWEWQQAATGGNAAYEYPWGVEWESGRANTYESELNKSTAVGMYPLGASLCGALDMTGTVWEWCLNEFDKPSHVSLSGEARRVLRGGSWINDLDFGRAAYRSNSHPNNRNDDIGFRVLCSSPIA